MADREIIIKGLLKDVLDTFAFSGNSKGGEFWHGFSVGADCVGDRLSVIDPRLNVDSARAAIRSTKKMVNENYVFDNGKTLEERGVKEYEEVLPGISKERPFIYGVVRGVDYAADLIVGEEINSHEFILSEISRYASRVNASKSK